MTQILDHRKENKIIYVLTTGKGMRFHIQTSWMINKDTAILSSVQGFKLITNMKRPWNGIVVCVVCQLLLSVPSWNGIVLCVVCQPKSVLTDTSHHCAKPDCHTDQQETEEISKLSFVPFL